MKKILLLIFLSFSFLVANALPKNKALKLLFWGDSYTVGQGIPKEDSYPYLLKAKLEEQGYQIGKLLVLGKTGMTSGGLIAEIRATNDYLAKDSYDYVFILTGVNNQYQGRTLEEFSLHLQELLKTAKRCTGGDISKVMILNIPDYSYTPFTKGTDRAKIFKEIKEFNIVVNESAEYLHVPVVDVSSFSKQVTKDKTLLAPDGLHYSKKMYALWIEKVLPILLKEK